MFKKITILTLLVTTLFVFGCGKYTVDKALTDEQIETYEAEIVNNLEILGEDDVTVREEVTAKQSIGVFYEQLGDYKKAIKYYEQALELDATDYASLNNLAGIYEEVGELEKAKEYIAELYINYSETRQVVSDTVRIYTESKEYDLAVQVITAYGIYLSQQGEIAEADNAYLSETYDYIMRYEEKHGN